MTFESWQLLHCLRVYQRTFRMPDEHRVKIVQMICVDQFFEADHIIVGDWQVEGKLDTKSHRLDKVLARDAPHKTNAFASGEFYQCTEFRYSSQQRLAGEHTRMLEVVVLHLLLVILIVVQHDIRVAI